MSQETQQNEQLLNKDTNNNETSVKREFGLSSLAIDNGTTVLVIIAIIVTLGALAYVTMPRENFPEVKLPQVYVGVPYPGNSPLDMENLVARHIEKELKSVSDIKEIRTTCVQDFATIIAEFDVSIPVEDALQDVKDAVDKAKPDLPNDLPSEPNVFEVNLSELPIMNINISGTANLAELKDYAEYLQDEFEALKEVNKAEIIGIPEKEVSISVRYQDLEARELSFYDIEQAIQRENVTISGGDILTDNLRRNVRVVGEFKTMEEIRNIIIAHEKQNIVYLKDVADVSFGYEERESYAREYAFNKNMEAALPIVTIDIIKQNGENLLTCSDEVNRIVKYAEENIFPEAINVQIINDQSKFTRSMVSDLENSIIMGVLLVVLVLLFFMGLRNALFVGVAIPLSMLMGFLMLSFSGATLNTMVLFSLILALGMLVDNGIVVVENIYRLMSEGLPPIQAAKEGVGEVAVAIIASTATTLAAFVPLLFWNDVMGEFFRFLPLTLIMVLGSSLFVGLVINPMLTSKFMRIDDPNAKTKYRNFAIIIVALIVLATLCYLAGAKLWGGIFVATALLGVLNKFILTPSGNFFQARIMPALERSYQAFIGFALTGFRPILFFTATIGMLIGAIMLMGAAGLKVEFFPTTDPQYVNVFIQHPIGTDIEKTNTFANEIQDIVIDAVAPYDFMIESVLIKVGEGTSDPMGGQPSLGGTPNKSRVTVSFVDFVERNGVSSFEVMDAMREAIKGYAGVQITVDKDANGPPTGPPINIEIVGEDYENLINISEDVKRYLTDSGIPGIEELKLDLETGKPELLLEVDRDKARRFGLSTQQIAGTVRTAVFGKEISTYKEGEDDYPINLRFDQEERYNLQSILNQRITFKNNRGVVSQIPVSAVADVQYTSTFGSVNRKDLDRVVTVYSNVVEGYNANEIVAQYKNLMSKYDMPEGYSFKFTGEQQEQQESSEFLMFAMLVAVMLIFLIMVAQFNSVSAPFIVIMSVLFSTIGVFLGYVIFRMDFIIMMTGIGIISLAGIVVNNAIVLIDYIMLLRERRREQLGLDDKDYLPKEELTEVIIEAGTRRLRPVLLTAITTVLGLIPLATGFNINFYTLLTELNPNIFFGGQSVGFWAPMAWTVIYGLVFATFLTLVIVPVMYLGIDRMKSGIFGRSQEIKAAINQQPNEDDDMQLAGA